MRLYDRLISGIAPVQGVRNDAVFVSDRWVLTQKELDDHLAEAVCIDITNVSAYKDELIRTRGVEDTEPPDIMNPPFEKCWWEVEHAGRGSTAALTLFDGKTFTLIPFVSFGALLPPPSSAMIIEYGEMGWEDPDIIASDYWNGPDLSEDYKNGKSSWVMSHVVFLAINFCHCKNVEMVDALPTGTRQQRRAAQRKGVPQTRFKVLVIEPMKRVLHTEGGVEQHGLKKALHICRGHFAHYSEDKPLFGKYSGTFWKPAHVRGSADAGTVYKDYRVKPPKG